MNIVDSSGWLEYLSDGPQAKHFSPVLSTCDLMVISLARADLGIIVSW